MREPILQKVASGDAQAARELLDRYGGLVYSLARRFCYDASEIEDAVQEVFVAVWKSAERFDRNIATEDTFVSMVARRRLIDRRRKRQRRAHEVVDSGVADGVSTSDAPRTERSELAERAGEFLATLRPEQQTCLRLSICQGYSHEQVSKATGIPLGTVKTHVRRGLIALRDALQNAARGKIETAPRVFGTKS